ncbi:MAG: glycosyltransferase [Planctomycetota bacterium]|jgi:glycosyltransferase involved in cell wall biosynthesis|nr:glycosyltransferase [Planctomycetota bacterium]
MHVMHVMASLSPAGAGVYEAVLGATRAFVQGGAGRVTIVGATDRAESWPQVRRAWEEAGAEVITVPWWAIVSCGSFGAVRVQTKARSVDAVHGHGLWCGASVAAAALSRQLDCPLVISPHGMLERWARRHHGRRKWLAWTMAERAAVGRADLLQAMSEPETASCRAAGLLQPIVVYPVGIEIPAEVSKRGTEGEMRQANGLQTCLFLSRLHPVKGLSMLLEAWSIVRPVDWRLVIAGPDQHGYRAAMERLATHVGIADRVAFVGPVHGADKTKLLGEADLFVLPSHSENFGVAIAEALAAGIPVITTIGTPWSMLPAHAAGWWVPPDVTSLAAALREATSLPSPALREMGQCGRALARERCDWPAIAATSRDAYRWLLEGGTAPSAIRFAEQSA